MRTFLRHIAPAVLLFTIVFMTAQARSAVVKQAQSTRSITGDSISLQVLGSGGNFSLHWVVPPSLSCLTFRVERAWDDAYGIGSETRWIAVGQVPGLCDVLESVPYSWVDRSAGALERGTLQYRLAVQTTGGDRFYTYSGPILLAAPEMPEIAGVYPQPASGQVHISLVLPADGRAELRLYDLSGRLISSPASHAVSFGLQSLVLDLAAVPAGSYVLDLAVGDDRLQRLVRVAR
jgi:hypothetical protein